MKSKLIHENSGSNTYVLVFDSGDEAIGELSKFVTGKKIGAARLSGIGAFREVTLGYFDWQTKTYKRNHVGQQVELLSLIGDIALDKGQPKVHAHAVVGLPDGTTRGGHLLEAHVRPTLELILVESPAHLHKEHDPESGLALIRI
jgi:predicted DNA-binding protein with PD1-like motif